MSDILILRLMVPDCEHCNRKADDNYGHLMVYLGEHSVWVDTELGRNVRFYTMMPAPEMQEIMERAVKLLVGDPIYYIDKLRMKRGPEYQEFLMSLIEFVGALKQYPNGFIVLDDNWRGNVFAD